MENDLGFLQISFSPSPTFSSINDCPEDIQAYVKEVTQDIATEIKSELREVISQVDGVLESTEPLDNNFNLATFHHLTSAEELKSSDAVSVTDVAQYLRDMSIEMASEVKSEIREMCASVKDFNEHPRRSSPTDLEGLKLCLKEVMGDGLHRRCESVIGGGSGGVRERTGPTRTVSVEGAGGCDLKTSRSESFPVRSVSSPSWHNTSAASSSSSSTAGHIMNESQSQLPGRYTGTISKLSDSTETASRDSGINMCFGDVELNQSAFNTR